MSCSTVYQIPGPRGPAGTNGTNGTDGENAFTTLAVGFTMPAALGAETITLTDASWVIIGQFIEIDGVGTFEVTGISGNDVTVENAYDGTAGSYPNNVAPGSLIPAGLNVGPSVMQ